MANIKEVTAAGGVVFRTVAQDALQVILIYRRGVWDLPKGKNEEGETIEECAVREVAEEIGLSGLPDIVGVLQNTYHEYQQNNIRYGKTTHWFAMQYKEWEKEKLVPQSEEGIEKVEWASVEEAIDRVGYKNLVDVLESFSSWVSS
ncbi:NUDIX hydrolase [Fodinibius saliphilus]|uniref:NUDIX hydrolase n=1 Tax=Fodinibius saliphilus TaxID=1920650 RepID=UPI0011091D43|nr:NUDIX domain-containing protein [Fodinibius saliphilus]